MSLLNLSSFMTNGLLSSSRSQVFRIKHLYTGEQFALKKIQRTNLFDHIADFSHLTHFISCGGCHNVAPILGFTMIRSRNDLKFIFTLCVLMELYEGSMEDEITRRRKRRDEQEEGNEEEGAYFTQAELIKMLRELLVAFAYLQCKFGIAHCDIKPSNILIDKKGGVVISDLMDCYRQTEFSRPKFSTMNFVGTGEFMSPERKKLFLGKIEEESPSEMKEDIDPWRSDVFSFGLTMLRIATLGSAEPLERRLDMVEGRYGWEVRRLMEEMLEKEAGKRADFKGLMEKEEVRKWLGIGKEERVGKQRGGGAKNVEIEEEEEEEGEEEEERGKKKEEKQDEVGNKKIEERGMREEEGEDEESEQKGGGRKEEGEGKKEGGEMNEEDEIFGRRVKGNECGEGFSLIAKEMLETVVLLKNKQQFDEGINKLKNIGRIIKKMEDDNNKWKSAKKKEIKGMGKKLSLSSMGKPVRTLSISYSLESMH